jgi:hypothetical protein
MCASSSSCCGKRSRADGRSMLRNRNNTLLAYESYVYCYVTCTSRILEVSLARCALYVCLSVYETENGVRLIGIYMAVSKTVEAERCPCMTRESKDYNY